MSEDSMTERTMAQTAPYPEALASLIERLDYRRPGWSLRLFDDFERDEGSRGLTLIVTARVADSYHPEATIGVNHYFPVPPATFNERSWREWLWRRLSDVDDHERAEYFVIDGERPFAPLHGPGNDPYMRVEATYEEAHTSYLGVFTDHRDEGKSDGR